jgi:hypothetical protein
VTLDRTKPPPFIHVAQAEDDLWDAWSNDGEWNIRRPGCATEDEAIRLAWHDYDRITLPVRVALLRELAAELRAEGHNSGHWTDEKVVSSICAEMERRADALEAGK